MHLDTWSSPNAVERFIIAVPVDDDFIISAQLCVLPERTSKKAGIIQIASHGPAEYSYVDAAVRLGVGQSSEPDA
ncbi:hypothetical protein PG996_015844 [Apiospora saccharicola]|uniref:Uncharacterized protein n=1 Tax=Apiospora saccharicola TaxID=335842 RepID=A0ABR1TPG0_9PEZI